MENGSQSSWIRLYAEGRTLQEIAELSGVSSMTVLRHLRTNGVETRNKGRRKTEGERRCTVCKISQSLKSLTREARQATGYGFTCRTCSVLKSRKHQLRKFGLDEELTHIFLPNRKGVVGFVGGGQTESASRLIIVTLRELYAGFSVISAISLLVTLQMIPYCFNALLNICANIARLRKQDGIFYGNEQQSGRAGNTSGTGTRYA